ncbi:MAG: hypothetical protein HUJ26_19060 [Planctomycetaceae bacterium]|nr:hypothetical protein [Planctomycetaceae bacterium]
MKTIEAITCGLVAWLEDNFGAEVTREGDHVVGKLGDRVISLSIHDGEGLWFSIDGRHMVTINWGMIPLADPKLFEILNWQIQQSFGPLPTKLQSMVDVVDRVVASYPKFRCYVKFDDIHAGCQEVVVYSEEPDLSIHASYLNDGRIELWNRPEHDGFIGYLESQDPNDCFQAIVEITNDAKENN